MRHPGATARTPTGRNWLLLVRMLVTVTGETGTHCVGQVLDLSAREARWLLARRYAVAERRAPDPPETAKSDRPVEDR